MIVYYTKKGSIKIKHVLFPDKIKTLDSYKFANYSYTCKNFHHPLFIKVRRQTIIIDLTQDIQSIFKEFGYYNRRKIRKAAKINLAWTVDSDLKEFVPIYNEFARKKGLKLLSIESLQGINDYTVTKVTHNNTILAARYYIIDQKHRVVRAVYGVTNRLDQHADTKIAGWANRYLHFEDIKYFKDLGFKTYDLGGTAEHTKKIASHHIDEFKREFGGQVVDEYVYESIPLFLALKFKEIFYHHYPY